MTFECLYSVRINNMVRYQRLIFQRTIQIHFNTYPICKQVSECLCKKTMLPAVQATEEQLIAP